MNWKVLAEYGMEPWKPRWMLSTMLTKGTSLSRPASISVDTSCTIWVGLKTSHSGLAEPMRRPGTSGEKMMRRSVEVSVPPPGDS